MKERVLFITIRYFIFNLYLQFLTLKESDEKIRLVPVLNTILKLSPEETNKLQSVAKGDYLKLNLVWKISFITCNSNFQVIMVVLIELGLYGELITSSS